MTGVSRKALSLVLSLPVVTFMIVILVLFVAMIK